jgi:hypothetical protein
MKKITLFCGAVLIATTLLFVACGKDKEATISKFFNVENATLVSEDMPEATSDQTIDVAMNKNVIPGGSSFVTLTSENVAKKILVGMKDQVGYYELVPESDRDNEYSFVLMVDQNIALGEEENSFTVQVAIVDENNDISQIWESIVELKEVGTGALQVSLSFDNAKDVDLHLIEPEYMTEYGETADFWLRHIYFGNHVSYNGGELDLDSNPGCSLDYINNENITYNDSTAYVAPGTYKVYVDLFENCDPEVATNYVVTVFYGGVLLASRSGIFEVGAESTYNPINADYVDQNDPFLTFTIGNQGQRRVKAFEPASMTESAIEKMAVSEANR